MHASQTAQQHLRTVGGIPTSSVPQMIVVSSALSDYIVKNYKKLLVCVARSDTSFDEPSEPLGNTDNRRRRRSRRRTRRDSEHVAEDGELLARGTSICVHADKHLQFQLLTDCDLEDPLRGCVSSRSVGPRSSGDFVIMGCMQV